MSERDDYDWKIPEHLRVKATKELLDKAFKAAVDSLYGNLEMIRKFDYTYTDDGYDYFNGSLHNMLDLLNIHEGGWYEEVSQPQFQKWCDEPPSEWWAEDVRHSLEEFKPIEEAYYGWKREE